MKPGKFIVIEGTDGSGKGTHTKLLVEWLTQNDHNVISIEFPRHGQPSAYFVDKYLSGAYGLAEDTDAYKASMFYALDRFDASQEIFNTLSKGVTVIADRYVGSNMAHQGGKITSQRERAAYFTWNSDLEFEILGIPRPDMNIVLRMPTQIAQGFVDKKGERAYLNGKSRDIHESDYNHLLQASKTYDEMVELFPQQFTVIECYQNQRVRSIEDIQNDIRALVQQLII